MRKTLGITGKLVASSVGIFAALWLAMTLYSVSQLQDLLYEQNVRRVEAQILNWIEANMSQITITRDQRNLEHLVDHFRSKQAIGYVVILDADRRILAQSGLPKGLSDQGPASEVARVSSQLRHTRDSSGQQFFELVTPVKGSGTGMSPELDTMFELAAGNGVAGYIRAGIAREDITGDLKRLAPHHILLYTLLVVVALVVNIALASRVVKPMKIMARVAKHISAGDFSERVRHGPELGDEVGDLARNFNQMADGLAESREKMAALYADLERKVAERTLELEDANRRLQELDELKSDFLSTVSHELRTPLTSIKAFTELLLDSPLDEPTQKRYLDIIDKETDRLTRLISDLLDLAKIERGEISWTMVQTDLREIVYKAVNPLITLGQTRGIRIEVAPSEAVPVCVDADRIQQVITNLVGNAIKFSSDSGHIGLRIEERANSGPRAARPGSYVAVSVTDTGPGIPREQKEHIFSRFYQDPRNYARRSGTGLGLAISREIVGYHGGEIWVDSELGLGSTFYFTVPLQREEDVLAEARKPHAEEGMPNAEKSNGV